LTDLIRLAVLDDLPLFRRGIKDALADTKFQVVAEGQATEVACQLVLKCMPHFVLIDIDRPGDGLKVAERVLAATATKVVVLTASVDEEDVANALRIGVHGCILKSVDASELVVALNAIYDGQRHITPALATRILLRKKAKSIRKAKENELKLTSRDKQVLALLLEGLTSPEIGKRQGGLGLHTGTVKNHLTGLFLKMRVRNRLEAVVRAKAMGVGE
jgi:two-component system, NarL family, nitrate/nitrite response regulator NarL